MTKKRIHRVSVYLLDATRHRVLLAKSTSPPFVNKYIPMTANLNTRETPVETLRTLVSQTTDLDFEFLGHGPSLPIVLDRRCIKIFPPFHVQVLNIDTNMDFVDSVYLGQLKAAPDFKEGGPLSWFNEHNMRNVPAHVRRVVRHILQVMKP